MVEPMALSVTLPDPANAAFGVAEQSLVFAVNASATTFPAALGMGIEAVMLYVPGWSAAAVPPIFSLTTSSVRTVEFDRLPQVRSWDVISEQSPWKLLKRTASPVTPAVRLDKVQVP
jgi:hypothetical protein